RKAGSEGSMKQTCESMDKNRIEGARTGRVGNAGIPGNTFCTPSKECYARTVRRLQARVLRITYVEGWNLCGLQFLRPPPACLMMEVNINFLGVCVRRSSAALWKILSPGSAGDLFTLWRRRGHSSSALRFPSIVRKQRNNPVKCFDLHAHTGNVHLLLT